MGSMSSSYIQSSYLQQQAAMNSPMWVSSSSSSGNLYGGIQQAQGQALAWDSTTIYPTWAVSTASAQTAVEIAKEKVIAKVKSFRDELRSEIDAWLGKDHVWA